MAKRTWTVMDVDQDCFEEGIVLSSEDVGGAATGYCVTKRTLHGGLRQGVDVIEVDNGACRFVLVPTRGMGVWHARAEDVLLGWKSPVRGPVHPAFVRLDEPSGLGWLDGFDELLVRCGLESNGAPEFRQDGTLRYGLHGKIANIPAHRVEVAVDGDSGEIRVTGVVDEARLFGNKLRLTSTVSTQAGRSGLTVTDVVENLSAEPGDLELLYHINFGTPLLDPGARVVLPVIKVAPRDPIAAQNVAEWDIYGPETPGLAEAVFFFNLAGDPQGTVRALLHDARADKGVTVRFNKNQLPCFTLWKNRQAADDGYVTGLEPGTNFPNIKSFERQKGRVIQLAPGQARTFEVALEIHTTPEAVAEAQQAIARLQGTQAPEVAAAPDPEWSQG